MTVPDILFALSAVAVVGLSLCVVLARNPVRSTLLLILSFLPVSLMYLLMQASFAAILQVMVYAGAIMMLFTFVIMMINPAPNAGEIPDGDSPGNPAAAGSRGVKASFGALWRGDFGWLLLLGGIGLILIPPVRYAAAHLSPHMPPVTREGFGTVHALSRLIFVDPANNPLTVSFELISILILVGVIAAVNFGRRAKGGSETRPYTPPEPPVTGGAA
jgi:NADH-quinone oxidoreductase subunit J